ncbi:hypothetical protein MNEG_2342 [Monoraphidium neglectum]|jgi:hypothetical protein|uniref:Ankyrin repeat domain-containing protein n=1 Tax=Monoraphidium neglectum TaxID=145388 RepID=A0A0D2MSW9_9CHLO|nr:hypothetical protein MNEG_2342 [Monoraphidium neglectum]KIZ05620.1 hypothetical protein MNEG_2342 [Monoraphidium neglectum]|eukprot:XP_013904639.1 hypothetical protein MNEG_2342 [Monoraphidium neglectum]
MPDEQRAVHVAAAPEAVSHPEVLALILERLPDGAQLVTAGALSRGWRQWAAARAAGAALRRRGGEPFKAIFGERLERLAAFGLPLWFARRCWPRLTAPQRLAAASRAAYHGDCEQLRWALAAGCPRDAYLCAAAAGGGCLEALRFLRAEGCPWDEETGWAAAHGGHLEVLRWLHGAGCPWGAATCHMAARRGHLDVLRWLHGAGRARLNAPIFQAAAWGGHLEVLKWARGAGFAWDRWACFLAAEAGHLEILRWARGAGCPWDRAQCLAAAQRHPQVVEWISGQPE